MFLASKREYQKCKKKILKIPLFEILIRNNSKIIHLRKNTA